MDDRQRDISQEQPPAEATNPDPATTQAPSPTEPVPGEPPPVSDIQPPQEGLNRVENPEAAAQNPEKSGKEDQALQGKEMGGKTEAKERSAVPDGESQKSLGNAEEPSEETARATGEAPPASVEKQDITEAPAAATGTVGHGNAVADRTENQRIQAANEIGITGAATTGGYDNLPPEQREEVDRRVDAQRIAADAQLAASQKTPGGTPVVATKGKEGPGGP